MVALADRGDDGERARSRLQGETLAAPELVDLEVVSAWRRLLGDQANANIAISALRRLPLIRARHLALIDRCWELRENLTPYDASYVALAEALDCPLVTADRAIAEAAGIECAVELLG